MGTVHVTTKVIIVKTTIELDELETAWFKQIWERAEAIGINLGPEVQDFWERIMAQLPQEA